MAFLVWASIEPMSAFEHPLNRIELFLGSCSRILCLSLRVELSPTNSTDFLCLGASLGASSAVGPLVLAGAVPWCAGCGFACDGGSSPSLFFSRATSAERFRVVTTSRAHVYLG